MTNDVSQVKLVKLPLMRTPFKSFVASSTRLISWASDPLTQSRGQISLVIFNLFTNLKLLKFISYNLKLFNFYGDVEIVNDFVET